MNNSVRAITAGLLLGCVSVLSAGVSITVYNDNFAVVRDTRDMEFDKGLNKLEFTDVASAIDPTSVSFKSLGRPDVRVLEQNYEYDLVNTDSLLKRYIDKNVIVYVKGSGSKGGSRMVGKLAANVGNDLIVEQGDGEMLIISRNSVESISLEAGPEDLVTKPTLVWLANADRAGTKECEVTYTTSGLSWKADYTAVLNEDDSSLDFSGWVTIDNRSGAGYKDAKLKLIAGDVRRVNAPRERVMYKGVRAMAVMEDSAAGFEEKSFMEYHMYTLGRPSTVNNNQTKQIEFIEPVLSVPCEKKYIYKVNGSYFRDSSRSGKVNIVIKFDNEESDGLGIALPKGKVRTFKADSADGSMEFVGEDTIDHTPVKEDISLYIGNAFDLVAEDVITDQKNGSSWHKVSREVTLKNRKDEAVVIDVEQNLARYHNWEIDHCDIDGKMLDYKKIDASTVGFSVRVPAGEEVKLSYNYTESW